MISGSKTLTILYNVQTTGNLVIAANQWHSFFYTHKFDPAAGTTTINVYIDLVLDITKVLAVGTYMQDDINGLLTIGQEYDGGPVKSDFYSGYIWEAKLYNYAVPLSTYQGEVLGTGKPASATFTLSTCSLNQYVNSAGTCVSCSTCTTGCVSGASCYVCADPLCAYCTTFNAGSCVSCQSNAAAVGGVCTCNGGYYYDSATASCGSCDTSCSSCSAAGPNACDSCKASAQLATGSTGACVCTAGYYPSPNPGNCVACDATCLTCQGSGSAQCKSCKGVATISGGGSVGTCVCPSTHYPSPDSSNCQPCDTTCLTCQGGGTTLCKSCKGAATISGGGSTGSCDCPSTHYPSPDSSNCKPCDNTCLTCQGSGTSQCKSCKGAAIISGGASVGSCVCPSTHYPSLDSSNCLSCDITCLTCQGTGPTLCNSCKSVATINGGATVGSCDCPSTHYPAPDSSDCQPCDTTCLTCQGPATTQCKSCKGAATLSASVGSCSCPSTHYPAPDSSNCQPCDTTCLTCQGPGPSQCVTCFGAAAVSSGACVCPSTHFPAADVTNCQPCDTTCLTCQGLGTTQCKSCKGAATLGGTVGVCTCLYTHFPSPDAGNCLPCHGTCLTCQGGNSFQCTSCKSTAQISSGAVGTCACPSSDYPSPDSSNCQPCASTCLTCAGPVACAACKGAASLGAGGVCQCPSQYFPSPDAGNCALCGTTCADCQGPASSQCIACFGVAVLSPSPVGSCTCPSTHFPSPDPSNCQPCASTCLSCATATQCLSCKSVAVLAAGVCSCPATYYPDPDATNCSPCHGTCSSCVGGGANQCSSCFAGAGVSGGITGACVCVSGTFPSPDSSSCSPCDVTCKECQGAGPTQCTVCKSVAAISTPVPGPCTCPPAYSPNPSDCVPCDVSCLTCAGAGRDRCASCYPGAFMTSAAPAACQCAGGHYPSPLANNCQPCNASCASCRGPSASDCTACKGAAIIEAGQTTGRCTCPTAYYALSAGTACLQCHETCLECTQGTDTDCVKCYDGAELQSSGECRCSAGKFPSPNSRTCLPCDSTCATCAGADPAHCTSCFPSASVFPESPGSCLCNSGFIPSPDASACRPVTEYFSGKLISKNTTLLLMFSAVLAQELLPENITLDLMPTLEDIGNFTWHMSPLVPCSKYEIAINSTSPVPDNSTAEVTFLEKVVSVSSAVLSCKSLSTVIHVSANSSSVTPLLSPSVVSATHAAATTVVITTGVGSVLSCGTSALWILVNNMQVLSYIPLSYVPLPVTTRSVLSATNSIQMLPNPFFFLAKYEGGLPSHAEDYGFHSGLFLYNSGEVVTSLGVLLCWLCAVVVLYQIPFLPLRLYTHQKLQEFRWGNFVRFWIEVYLPLAVNSGLQAYVLKSTSDVYTVSASFALLCGTALLLTPALLFKKVKSLGTASKDNAAERSRWKSITEEFSGLSHIAWSYYPAFCLRRLIYALNQLFLQDFPILQGIINLSHCALVTPTQFTVYCFKYVTFQQRCMKLLTVTCEVGVMFVFALTQCFYLDLFEVQTVVIERLILADLVLMAGVNLAVVGYLVVLEILKVLKRAKALWSQRTKIMTVNFDNKSIAL